MEQKLEWGAFGVPETFLVFENKIVKNLLGHLTLNQLKKLKKL